MVRRFHIALATTVLAFVLVAPAADAESTSDKFRASSYPAWVSGTGPGSETITTEGGTIECWIDYLGLVSEASQTFQLHPDLYGCSAFGFIEATVQTEFCDFQYHINTKLSSTSYRATMDVVCPTGNSIKVTAATCSMEIKAQTGLSSVKLKNEFEVGDVEVDPEISKLAYTVTKDGFLCPFNGTGNKTDGTYTAFPGTDLSAAVPLAIG